MDEVRLTKRATFGLLLILVSVFLALVIIVIGNIQVFTDNVFDINDVALIILDSFLATGFIVSILNVLGSPYES